jgi:type IV secretory pathway VirD2 relaxase
VRFVQVMVGSKFVATFDPLGQVGFKLPFVWRMERSKRREVCMTRRSRLSLDRVDSDRVGRLGGRRSPERSVSGELAKRLRGFKGRVKVRAGGGSGGRQRVVVKALVSRHRPGKARGSIVRHASYLGRESASADGKPGVFYDAARDQVNARQEVMKWADDRHHFRLIVSPEHGADIPDMTAYVRETMRRVQRDLDTKLEWVAVNHHNTDNPHAHVMIRGRREDGTDLVISRRYISYGIRDRASEVATELLGERSAEEVRTAKTKEVEAERFTSLDRTIERHLENGKIDVSPARHIGFGAEDRKLVVGRLQFLEQMDLAHKGRGTKWEVEGNFNEVLRDLGARNDIIKQVYSSLGSEAGSVERVVAGAVPSAPVSGVVIAKGSPDEIGEDRFVLVRDSEGRPHYGRVRNGEDFRGLRAGSVVELGAGTDRKRLVAEQIVAIAHSNEGIYSAELHGSFLRASQPAPSDREVASLVRSATSRLAFVAGHEQSGVRAMDDAQFAVDPDRYQRFAQRGTSHTDVRVIAAHPLAEQVNAHASTWLDRQAFGDRPDARLRDHPAIQEAIQQRQDWLIQHAYADRDPDNGDFKLRPDALRNLAAEERSEVAKQLADKYDRPVEALQTGDSVTGEYQGTRQLHGGRLAVVVTEDSVVVASVNRTPDIATGSAVTLERTSGRTATVLPIAGQSLDQQTGRAVDGLEAGR